LYSDIAMTAGSKALRMVSSKPSCGAVRSERTLFKSWLAGRATLGQRKLELRGRRDRKQLKRALPTIAEVEFEDQAEAGGIPANFLYTSKNSLPDGWPKALASPWRLANDDSSCKTVAMMLKDKKYDQSLLLAWLCPALLSLALSECGSCVVHTVLEIVTGSDRNMIASQFHGCVKDLCTSPSGHLVLSELIGSMPVSDIGFVALELEGKASALARHKFGYRVLEAMIMHGSHVQTSNLSVELAHAAVELSKDLYGQNVLRHLLEHGSDECRYLIMQCLMAEMRSLSRNQRQAEPHCRAQLDYLPHEHRQQGLALGG